MTFNNYSSKENADKVKLSRLNKHDPTDRFKKKICRDMIVVMVSCGGAISASQTVLSNKE